MKVLRTPEERFDGLEDFDYPPYYVEVDDGDGDRLRIAYLDVGPKDAEVVLCMHGQPTWSYLYRKMIPLLTAAGYRVIAPDLVGFGRSDKPAARSDYTYARHVHWQQGFLRELDLNDITLVCQDWGGLIGLRLLAANPERFARVVTANTGLPDAQGLAPEMAKPMRDLYATIPALPPAEMGAKLRENQFGAGFMYWIKFCAEYPDLVVSELIGLSAMGEITEAQRRAYDAPFPSEEYKHGARQFPSLVPIFPDNPAVADNRAAWAVLERFDKPFLTAFSDRDPVTAGAHKRFQESVPGAKGQMHVTIEGAGHFLQEDAPEPLVRAIVDFCRANPIGGRS
jgi:haloalkane dehalogenase